VSIETLFPETKVGPYTVRPWSLGQLSEAAPALSEILAEAERLGFDIGKAMAGQFDEIKLARLILAAIVQVKTLLAISLRASVQEMEGLDLATATGLTKAVIVANWDHLKNSVALPAGGAAAAGREKTT
jgi:hypothetical protein